MLPSEQFNSEQVFILQKYLDTVKEQIEQCKSQNYRNVESLWDEKYRLQGKILEYIRSSDKKAITGQEQRRIINQMLVILKKIQGANEKLVLEVKDARKKIAGELSELRKGEKAINVYNRVDNIKSRINRTL